MRMYLSRIKLLCASYIHIDCASFATVAFCFIHTA
jgi:hypothetical protein